MQLLPKTEQESAKERRWRKYSGISAQFYPLPQPTVSPSALYHWAGWQQNCPSAKSSNPIKVLSGGKQGWTLVKFLSPSVYIVQLGELAQVPCPPCICLSLPKTFYTPCSLVSHSSCAFCRDKPPFSTLMVGRICSAEASWCLFTAFLLPKLTVFPSSALTVFHFCVLLQTICGACCFFFFFLNPWQLSLIKSQFPRCFPSSVAD